MKFIFAIIALVLAVNGVQSATTSAQVKAEVYVKVQLPQVANIKKIVDAFQSNALKTAQNNNKTLWDSVQTANKTIQGNVKSTIASLVASKNATVAAGAGLLSAAILSVQGLYDVSATKLSAAYFVSVDTCRIDNKKFQDDILTAFVTANATIEAIAEDKVNILTYKVCIETSLKEITAMYKVYDEAQKVCAKNFEAKDKIFLTKGSLSAYLTGNISLVAQAQIDIVKACLRSNQISDVKGLEASSLCTIDSFVFCITQGIPNTVTFTTSFTALSDAVVAAYVDYHTASQVCMANAYAAAIATATTIEANLVICLTNP